MRERSISSTSTSPVRCFIRRVTRDRPTTSCATILWVTRVFFAISSPKDWNATGGSSDRSHSYRTGFPLSWNRGKRSFQDEEKAGHLADPPAHGTGGVPGIESLD